MMRICDREVLVEHIDGPVGLGPNWCLRRQIVQILIERGWLRFRSETAQTHLTDRGRAILAKTLGEWADQLARYRHMKDDRLAESLDRINLPAPP